MNFALVCWIGRFLVILIDNTSTRAYRVDKTLKGALYCLNFDHMQTSSEGSMVYGYYVLVLVSKYTKIDTHRCTKHIFIYYNFICSCTQTLIDNGLLTGSMPRVVLHLLLMSQQRYFLVCIRDAFGN